MSLRYRGAGLTAAQLAELGKVLIDASDTTADFLSAKLLVTSNLTKTIQNVAGDENILLDVSLSGIETTLDGRYVLLAPASKNQTILPTTDNTPLTIKGFAGGASKLLDIFRSTGTQQEMWYWTAAGDLAMNLFSGNLTPRLRMIGPLTNQSILWKSSGGVVNFGDSATDVGILDFAVNATDWDFMSTTVGASTIHRGGITDIWFDSNLTTLKFGNDAYVFLIRGTKIDNTTDLMQFLSFVLEQVSADPASHVTGRVYERTDLKELSWDDGTAFHRLIDGSPSGVDQVIQPLTNQIPLTLRNSALGGFAQLVLSGVEASGADRRIRENAGALEITDSTPTVFRSMITRGAPNVSVAHNAVSVAVAFSSSEPDTNYEITIVPAYNTSVWYTLKAITGFTANFGTAGPVGGSTFDWHIERIPRT